MGNSELLAHVMEHLAPLLWSFAVLHFELSKRWHRYQIRNQNLNEWK